MCGICGLVVPDGLKVDRVLSTMNSTLRHRGPDDSDVWLDRDSGVALGHRRLSILDLSPGGRQPMHSSCGRYVAVYNGEVYNHVELRKSLGGHEFSSTSDTETILAAISKWGLRSALERFVGMFAIGVWDRRTRKLSLVRDRMGVKPLYYGKLEDGWIFGSELKALAANDELDRSIDRGALSLYFRHNYIPAPFTVFQSCKKVRPGEIVELEYGKEPAGRQWWDIESVWNQGVDASLDRSDEDVVRELDELLNAAVSARMLSDVPLGAFLSGGIDSSTVVAIMQKNSSSPVKTFSIGFHEEGYNEASYAKAVASHIGTDHTELYVTSRDMLDVVPELPTHWDEPFADSSQIPTLILSRLTARQVTVSLSGDGGDELFAGYQRYSYTNRVWKMLSLMPKPLRSAAKGVCRLVPNGLFSLFGAKGQKIRWRLDALGMENFESLYVYLTSHFKQPAAFVVRGHEPESVMSSLPTQDHMRWMGLYDLLGYLPEDILTKVDRASMAASLEARVPLLDHRLVEFAAQLPTNMKVRSGKGKWALRQALKKYVPDELVDRPKMGFGIPIHRWLRSELREWAEDLLSPDALRNQGYIQPDMVEKMWREYLEGEDNWNYYLWDVLMFQAWLYRWK